MTTRASYPTISFMGEGALIVAFGNRVSANLRTRVFTLYDSLKARNVAGVTDIVPAYASLLVRFNPLSKAAEELQDILPKLLELPAEQVAPGKHHVIPVNFGSDDGPDLADVAEEHGLTRDEAISLFTGRDYEVYFLGFLPGFAYMGRLPRRLASARLSTPRVRLPAGSVGVAGVQTSVYPFVSPGGWRLIGRTGVRVWDPNRATPALFGHGDTVRFAATDEPVTLSGNVVSRYEAQQPVFRVLEPGVLSTIQDLGRQGQGHIGLSTGGVCDRDAALRANALVGNVPGAAVLEMTLIGPALEAMRSTTIALDGTDFGCRVDGQLVPPGVGWFVRAGAQVRFVQMSPSGGGMRAYMAVAGGFDAPIVLGSRGTCFPAGFGGYEGRALKAGDVLGVVLPPNIPTQMAGRYWMSRPDLALHGNATLRFVGYPGVARISRQALKQLGKQEWRVSTQSDRIGIRLEAEGGEGLAFRAREATSFGVVRGAIQVPRDGMPVLLNADHQTTGGYPLAGVVAQADWPVLAQLRAGDKVSFVEISREEAVAALAEARRTLLAGLTKLGLGARERDYALV